MTSNIDKILKSLPSLQRASDVNYYKFLDTPFATVTNLIGGIPQGRFLTVAG